ncbi:hypothetical protein QBE53_07340 [Vallitaleaceae bacterium 9-2]
MSIRPLDMQVMVPKLQEVSQIKHAQNQRSNLEQSHIASQNEKNVQHNQKSVVKSFEDQKADQEADAKEEGKNTYGYQPPNKKQKQNKEKKKPKSYHKIDVRI